MKERENQYDELLEKERPSTMRERAKNQMAIGLLALFWGSLLILKQFGIIEQNVSTLPFILTAFGLLLVAGAINAFRRVSHHKEVSTSNAGGMTNNDVRIEE
jgi:hypothetical protein